MINCILIQWLDEAKTNFRIINWNAVLTSPIVLGLDPDLEYLVKRIPYPMPEYDQRLTTIDVVQSIGDYDSECPTLKTWVTEYVLHDRPNAEKLISVEEAENDANYAIFPTNKHLKYMALAMAIIDRKASGLTITPQQQSILDKLQAKAQRIWGNHVTANAKKAQINASTPVDLDTNWAKTDPEDEANS